jgi:hypothetical protein
MANSFVNNILSVCKILNTHSVEYLIVGGTAVALHGYFRMSQDAAGNPTEKHDLDFWYNPTYDNYFKLLKALSDLGLDVSAFQEETAPNPKKSFFKLETDRFTLDLLPEIPGLTRFRDSFNERELSVLNEIEIPFISYQDLIRNKETLRRPKDINDINELKKLNPDK